MTGPKKTYSISRKLTTMNLLVSGSALLIACLSFIAYDLATFRENRISNLATQADIIGANCVSALLFDDPQSAETTLSALQASRRILAAGVYRPDGRPFAEYKSNHAIGNYPAPRITGSSNDEHWITQNDVALLHPIVSHGKSIGYVYIRSDLQVLRNRLSQYVQISLIVLTGSLIAALLISGLFRKAVADPIVGLAETARTVSRDRNYSIRSSQTSDAGELSVLIEAFNEMLGQIQERDKALQQAHDELEQRVQARTTELVALNEELEAFSYSVSHDLRAPLRSIDGFSQIVLEDYTDKLDASGKNHLQRIRSATQRMSALIDDMLTLARTARCEMVREKVDLSAMAEEIAAHLQESDTLRRVTFIVEPGLTVEGDRRLLHVVLENLLGNAWKFTSKKSDAQIKLGANRNGTLPTYFIRDNGAGFDMQYADKLFGTFRRLHDEREFPGNGVGLAIVQRILRRHAGHVWAESAVGQGATFYFNFEEVRR